MALTAVSSARTFDHDRTEDCDATCEASRKKLEAEKEAKRAETKVAGIREIILLGPKPPPPIVLGPGFPGYPNIYSSPGTAVLRDSSGSKSSSEADKKDQPALFRMTHTGKPEKDKEIRQKVEGAPVNDITVDDDSNVVPGTGGFR